MELNRCFKYRSLWMGIAMLWIILFHSGLEIPNGIISVIKGVGYGGVDIFVFASGLGAYYSYGKDHSPAAFLMRRIVRLAPIYGLFLIVWLPYEIVFYQMPLSAVIGNCFGVQGFTGLGYEFNWYITLLVIIYLLTPVFIDIVDHTKKLYQAGIFLMALLLISTSFWTVDGLMIIATRIPIYIVGLYFGRLAKQNYKLLKKDAILMGGCCFAGMLGLLLALLKFSEYLRAYGLYWYPFLLITPGMCIAISLVAMRVEKYKIVKMIMRMVSKVGECSFEAYLVHIFLLDIYKRFSAGLFGGNTNLGIMITLILVIPMSAMLHLAALQVKNKVTKARSMA